MKWNMNSTDSYLNAVRADEEDLNPYGKGGLSAYWRKNLSPLETVELANVLRALRKVTGFLGDNVGSVDWMGMSVKGKGRLVLDPELVRGAYPVPYEKVDVLVGIVVHEALHRVVWSERVWLEADKQAAGLTPRERLLLSKIISAGEDVYVDIISQKSVLGLYTDKVRKIALKKLKKIYSAIVIPSVDELLNLWWGSVGVELVPQPAPYAYRDKIDVFKAVNGSLKEIASDSAGILDRCGKRKDLYLDLWKEVYGDIKSWKIFDFSMPYYSDNYSQESSKAVKRSGLAMPLPEDMNEIEARLAVGSTDITPLILAVVGEEEADKVIPTSVWDFNIINSHPVIDPHLVMRLRKIFETYAERRYLVNRGLKAGKIDPRRLHRAPIDGRCFKEKQFRAEASWNITLLIDASASMRGVKWRMVENTVATIFTALKGTNNHLQAFGYYEMDNICMISRLIKDGKLLSLYPSGRTASGQAIIGAALQMNWAGGKRLMIHVTDGGSNVGCDVVYGINYCKVKGIDLVTLGSGYEDRDLMSEQYGGSIRFLDYLDQVPGAIESLLRKKIMG